MEENITLKEGLQKKKEELEQNIYHAVYKFESTTGCSVETVKLFTRLGVKERTIQVVTTVAL